jgi:transposase
MYYSLFSIAPKLLDRKIRIAYSFMSLRALKGRSNLIREGRDCSACSEQSEGIFCAPRNDNFFLGDCFAPSSRSQ